MAPKKRSRKARNLGQTGRSALSASTLAAIRRGLAAAKADRFVSSPDLVTDARLVRKRRSEA